MQPQSFSSSRSSSSGGGGVGSLRDEWYRDVKSRMDQRRKEWEEEMQKMREDFFQWKPTLLSSSTLDPLEFHRNIDILGSRQYQPQSTTTTTTTTTPLLQSKSQSLFNNNKSSVGGGGQATTPTTTGSDFLSSKSFLSNANNSSLNSSSSQGIYQRSAEDNNVYYTIGIDVGGYDPNDIHVTTSDSGVVNIHAQQKISSSSREFMHQFQIPDNVSIEKLRCWFDSEGLLVFSAPVTTPSYDLSGSNSLSSTTTTTNSSSSHVNSPIVRCSPAFSSQQPASKSSSSQLSSSPASSSLLNSSKSTAATPIASNPAIFSSESLRYSKESHPTTTTHTVKTPAESFNEMSSSPSSSLFNNRNNTTSSAINHHHQLNDNHQRYQPTSSSSSSSTQSTPAAAPASSSSTKGPPPAATASSSISGRGSLSSSSHSSSLSPRQFECQVNIGDDFEPQDISVTTVQHKLIVRAIHESITANGKSLREFSKEFDLPFNVNPETVTAKLKQGILYLSAPFQ